MIFNLYLFYDLTSKRGEDIFVGDNDTQANEILQKRIEAMEKHNMDTKNYTVLNVGAIDLRPLINKDLSNQLSFGNVLIAKQVYDINNIPDGVIPRDSMLIETIPENEIDRIKNTRITNTIKEIRDTAYKAIEKELEEIEKQFIQ